MSQTQTMTEETAPQASMLKNPFLFSVSKRNETAFKIKQLATGAHFLSLIVLFFLYFSHSDRAFSCFVFAAIMFAVAFFVPPTGMIQPEDAPEYAKKSLRFIPQHDGTPGTGVYDQMHPKKKSQPTNPKKKNK